MVAYACQVKRVTSCRPLMISCPFRAPGASIVTSERLLYHTHFAIKRCESVAVGKCVIAESKMEQIV